MLLKAGRRTEAEQEIAIARDLQAKSLESSRHNLSEILGQVAKPTNEITAPSQIAAAIPNSSENSKESGEGGGSEVVLIEESPLGTEQAARNQKLKDRLTEILARAFHNLGVIAAQQGQLAVGLEQFAAAAQWKADLTGLTAIGVSSAFGRAVRDCHSAVSRQVNGHPEDALARRMLGVSYYLTKSFPQVVQTLKSLEPTITTDPELTYVYGVSLIQVAEHKQAGKLFENLSQQNPKSAATRFYAGQGFAMLEDYEKALREFRSAAELDPKMLQVHYNAGQSLIRLHRFKDAEREFRAELLLNSADAFAKYHLAYVLLEQKQQTRPPLLFYERRWQLVRNMPTRATSWVKR